MSFGVFDSSIQIFVESISQLRTRFGFVVFKNLRDISLNSLVKEDSHGHLGLSAQCRSEFFNGHGGVWIAIHFCIPT